MCSMCPEWKAFPTSVPVTSSWSAKLPESYARIGISRGQPRGQSGYKMYRALAPGDWWNSVTPEEYSERYFAQLAKLDPAEVLAELASLADGRIPALLCFEKPHDADAWCHRAFCSVWLKATVGIDVFEYGLESFGAGLSHPKLPKASSLSKELKLAL